jgi:hypothetical protein
MQVVKVVVSFFTVNSKYACCQYLLKYPCHYLLLIISPKGVNKK